MTFSVRDRTQEFLSSVTAFQEYRASSSSSSLSSSPKSNNDNNSKKTANIYGEPSRETIEKSIQIHTLGNNLMESINETNDKIEQLISLAKLTSNFRDERSKIQSLMLDIKEDIESFKVDIKALDINVSQLFNKNNNSSTTNNRKNNENDNYSQHHIELIKILRYRYASLAKTFARACEVSTQCLQRQKDERDKYGPGRSKKINFRKVPRNRLQPRTIQTMTNSNEAESGNSNINSNIHSNSNSNSNINVNSPLSMHNQVFEPGYKQQNDFVKMRHRRLPPSRGRGPRGAPSRRLRPYPRKRGMDAADDDENEQLLSNENNSGGFSQNQRQLMQFEESSYNEQRAQDAMAVERQLTEIGQMMTKLATMVHEQRETIITINSNIDDSREHMEGAISELQKYLATLTGNRWLMIKVFAILIFFALFFALFIA